MSRANADTKSQCMQEQAFEWVQFPHYYSIPQMRTQVYTDLYRLLVKGNIIIIGSGVAGGGGGVHVGS